MIHIYFGKSASGKDTFARKFASAANYIKPLVSYTSRPIRNGEKDGIDYNFVSKDEFLKLIKNKKLIEYRTYETLVNGNPDTWYYGMPKVDPDEEWVAVADIKGIYSLIKEYGSDKLALIYVDTDDDIRKKRAIERGSFDESEWDRRALDDDEKFKEDVLKNLAKDYGKDIIVIHNDNYKPTFSKIISE